MKINIHFYQVKTLVYAFFIRIRCVLQEYSERKCKIQGI